MVSAVVPEVSGAEWRQLAKSKKRFRDALIRAIRNLGTGPDRAAVEGAGTVEKGRGSGLGGLLKYEEGRDMLRRCQAVGGTDKPGRRSG